TAECSQGRSKIVYRPCKKGGPVLIVFLQSQIRLDENLQNLIAIGPQSGLCSHPLGLGANRAGEKGRKRRPCDRLEQDLSIGYAICYAETGEVLAVNHEEVP